MYEIPDAVSAVSSLRVVHFLVLIIINNITFEIVMKMGWSDFLI